MFRSRPIAPVLAAGIALLGGCAPLEWHKADVTAEIRDRDIAECNVQARGEALRRVPVLYPSEPRTVIDNRGRVVTLNPSRYGDERFSLEQDLLRACMRERGYALQNRTIAAP
ncbi:MAG: hypothetical protein H6R21_229 [Proteobacteria bacterium]|nr:hypothetical protein [Pseudomonadota bacterium]